MKKTLKIIFLLVTVITLCSWGEKTVELLDSRKLIDLEKAIEISTPGGAAIFEDDQNDTDTEQNGSQNHFPSVSFSRHAWIIAYLLLFSTRSM